MLDQYNRCQCGVVGDLVEYIIVVVIWWEGRWVRIAGAAINPVKIFLAKPL